MSRKAADRGVYSFSQPAERCRRRHQEEPEPVWSWRRCGSDWTLGSGRCSQPSFSSDLQNTVDTQISFKCGNSSKTTGRTFGRTHQITTGLTHLLREKINSCHFLAKADPEASSARSVTSTIILAEFFFRPLRLEPECNIPKVALVTYLSRTLEMPPEQIWPPPPCSQPRTCCDSDPLGEVWTEAV